MALRRVRSKTTPPFESIVSDEWIARFPDDWDDLGSVDDAPPTEPPAVKRDRDEGRSPRFTDDRDY